MLGLELVVVLGVAVLVCSVVARRFRVAPPVLLVAGGALLGFVPALRQVHLPSEAVLLLFLPALLYWESLTTSLREIRNNLRVVVLMSTALVLVTAWAVAAAAHGLGLPWGPAWVLGAASPRPTRRRWPSSPACCRVARSPCCAPRAWSTTVPPWSSTPWRSGSRWARSTSACSTSPGCSCGRTAAGRWPVLLAE